MIMAAEASPSVPSGHNCAVLIAWIEENISPRPEQRYPGGCLVCTLDLVDNDKN